MSADKRAVVRKFKQYTYTDPAYNNEMLMYSVFVPEG
jgi:hypothetical protein